MISRTRRMLAALVAAGGGAFLVAALLLTRANPGSTTASTASLAGQTDAGAASGEVHFHPGRPAHIHAGSCDDLGEVAFPLNPVGAGEMTGAAMDGVAAMAATESDVEGLDPETPAEVGRITLGTRLERLARGEYALNIQISEYDYGNDIACGEVAGVVADGVLTFPLAERNGSGFSGMARLAGSGRQTEVEVFLVDDMASG